MNEKQRIEELKIKNELLKNKTEKLRLVRNTVAVISIIITMFTLIIGGNTNKTNSVDVNKTINTGVENPNKSNIENNNLIENSNNNIVPDDDFEDD